MAQKRSFEIYEDPADPASTAALRLQIEKCHESIKAKEELLDEVYKAVAADRRVAEASVMTRKFEAKARQYIEKKIELLEERNKDLVIMLSCVVVARDYLDEVTKEKEEEAGELREEIGRLKNRLEAAKSLGK